MATAPTPAEECPSPPFQHDIEELEKASNQQDQLDAKGKLASLKKINDEVEQSENKYKKEYESLKFRAAQSKAYEASRRTQLEQKVPEAERKRVGEIASCYDALVAQLKNAWIKARDPLPDLQKILTLKQIALADAEVKYKRALDYPANQKNLDELQTQSGKEIDAQNFRGALFLVNDIKANLKEPQKPSDFNHYLKDKAKAYFDANDEHRTAKVAFEQGTADAQKKKKDYEDAKAKRRENVLKQIAEEPFAEPTSTSTTSDGEGEREG
jgi:hypothetical protein